MQRREIDLFDVEAGPDHLTWHGHVLLLHCLSLCSTGITHAINLAVTNGDNGMLGHYTKDFAIKAGRTMLRNKKKWIPSRTCFLTNGNYKTSKKVLEQKREVCFRSYQSKKTLKNRTFTMFYQAEMLTSQDQICEAIRSTLNISRKIKSKSMTSFNISFIIRNNAKLNKI